MLHGPVQACILPERRYASCLTSAFWTSSSPAATSWTCVRLCRPAAQGRQPVWPVPLPQRKDPLLLRIAGQADLPLLRLQEGRRRHQLHHGDREPDVPRGRAVSGQEGQPAGAGGRRPAGRRGPAAPPCAGAEPRRRPLVLRPAVLAGGRGGAGVSGQAADPEKHRRPLRHGRIPRPVGRPAHRP